MLRGIGAGKARKGERRERRERRVRSSSCDIFTFLVRAPGTPRHAQWAHDGANCSLRSGLPTWPVLLVTFLGKVAVLPCFLITMGGSIRIDAKAAKHNRPKKPWWGACVIASRLGGKRALGRELGRNGAHVEGGRNGARPGQDLTSVKDASTPPRVESHPDAFFRRGASGCAAHRYRFCSVRIN